MGMSKREQKIQAEMPVLTGPRLSLGPGPLDLDSPAARAIVDKRHAVAKGIEEREALAIKRERASAELIARNEKRKRSRGRGDHRARGVEAER